jgi:hypothetical protein
MHFLPKPDPRPPLERHLIIEMAQGPDYRSSSARVAPRRERNQRLRTARREFTTHRQSPSGSTAGGVYHVTISHAG